MSARPSLYRQGLVLKHGLLLQTWMRAASEAVKKSSRGVPSSESPPVQLFTPLRYHGHFISQHQPSRLRASTLHRYGQPKARGCPSLRPLAESILPLCHCSRPLLYLSWLTLDTPASRLIYPSTCVGLESPCLKNRWIMLAYSPTAQSSCWWGKAIETHAAEPKTESDA